MSFWLLKQKNAMKHIVYQFFFINLIFIIIDLKRIKYFFFIEKY